MTVDKALEGRDTRMRLDLSPELQETLAVRGQLSDTAAEGTVRLRIGSDERKGPIWAEFKVTFHRPLPPNGRAFLHRELRGQDYHWMLRLTITSEQDVPEPTNPETRLAARFGWRKLANGDLRVAIFEGSDEKQWDLNEAYREHWPAMIGRHAPNQLMIPAE